MSFFLPERAVSKWATCSPSHRPDSHTKLANIAANPSTNEPHEYFPAQAVPEWPRPIHGPMQREGLQRVTATTCKNFMPESKTTTDGGAPMHAPDTKPAWKLSYAFDLPHYADFVIDADTEAEAERIAQALLDAGTLPEIMDGHAQACWDNACNERVFTSGPDDEDEEADRLPYYAKLNGIKLPEDWQTPPAAEPATQAPDPAAQLLEKIARLTPYSDGTPSSDGLPPDGEDAMRVLNHLIAEARALTSKGGAL